MGLDALGGHLYPYNIINRAYQITIVTNDITNRNGLTCYDAFWKSYGEWFANITKHYRLNSTKTRDALKQKNIPDCAIIPDMSPPPNSNATAYGRLKVFDQWIPAPIGHCGNVDPRILNPVEQRGNAVLDDKDEFKQDVPAHKSVCTKHKLYLEV